MSYNQDELIAPEWMNSGFFKKVLEYNGELKNVKIHDYQLSPATALGDHFASIMFRAKIKFVTKEGETKSCSVIIKTMPVAEGLKKEIMEKSNGSDIFNNEAHMYEKVLSKCADLLKKAGYSEMLAAKLVYHSSEPNEVLVFEDLKELEYFMFPRVIPNECEAAIIFSKLGQFHAATFQMEAEGCEDLKRTGSLFNIPGVESFPTFKFGVTYMLEILETLPGFELAVEKLRRITFKKLHQLCKTRLDAPSTYSVLNHGDYHIRNMMFKGKDEENISEVVLVDFQIPHWGSPAYDLYYMSAVIPFDQREKAYRTYFETFNDVLEKSNFKGKRPTYEQLKQELKSFQCLDLYFLSSLSAFFCTDKAEMDMQFESMLQDASLLRKFYRSKGYMSCLNSVLPNLLKHGVLDNIIDSL